MIKASTNLQNFICRDLWAITGKLDFLCMSSDGDKELAAHSKPVAVSPGNVSDRDRLICSGDCSVATSQRDLQVDHAVNPGHG